MFSRASNEIQVFLRGGLGNQLFQYASGLAIAYKWEKKLIIREDLLPRFEDSIGGISRWPNQISLFRHSGEVRSDNHQPEGKTNLFGKVMAFQRIIGDVTPQINRIFGIHASEKRKLDTSLSRLQRTRVINSYMSSLDLVNVVRHQLAVEVSQIYHASSHYRELFLEAKSLRPTIIHLRLGDYQGLKGIFGELSPSYFEDALLDSRESPRWLFTQDSKDIPESLLASIRPNKIIDGKIVNSSLENLSLMALGEHFVASNSTLSWWACVLSLPETSIVVPFLPGKVNNFPESLCLPNWRSINVAD
jgi:hypothetical protein